MHTKCTSHHARCSCLTATSTPVINMANTCRSFCTHDHILYMIVICGYAMCRDCALTINYSPRTRAVVKQYTHTICVCVCCSRSEYVALAAVCAGTHESELHMHYRWLYGIEAHVIFCLLPDRYIMSIQFQRYSLKSDFDDAPNCVIIALQNDMLYIPNNCNNIHLISWITK